jgi:hypothetical protein
VLLAWGKESGCLPVDATAEVDCGCTVRVLALLSSSVTGQSDHSRQRQICTYPKLILNPIIMLLFLDEFAISSNRLPYLEFNNRFATITNSIAKF